MSYARGAVVTLAAVAAPGYTFAGWSGDLIGTQDMAAVTMNADTVVTALFNPNAYALIVNVSGFGSVSRAPDQASYGLVTKVKLMRLLGRMGVHDGWRRYDSMNPMNPVVGVCTRWLLNSSLWRGDDIITAMSIVGGSVGLSPDRERFDPNETVELRATPAAGWRFAEWQGGLSGTSMTAQLPMATSREVVAVFQRLPEEKQWSVVFDGGPHGTITPSGTQAVSNGTTVRVRIEPDAGYQVDRFLIDGILLSLPTTAAQIYDVGPVTADSQVQCSFVAVPVVPKTHVVCFTIGSMWLTVDGQQTGMDAAAVIQNNRTLLPIERSSRWFGGTIEWHAELQVVTMC